MDRSTARLTMVATLAALLCLAVSAAAQRRFFYGWDETVRNIPYDGRFTFARIRYTPVPAGYWAGGQPSWMHGYPLAEQNLLQIMSEISALDAHVDDINVVTLDDPELFRYPIAYIIEVGFWAPTPQEIAALRSYLLKGGFLIVDDFKPEGWRGLPGGGWQPFAAAMHRVLPERTILRPRCAASDLSFVLRDPGDVAVRFSAGLQLRASRLPRNLRGQRSAQAPDGHRELQHRHLSGPGSGPAAACGHSTTPTRRTSWA